ncbi:O-antigen ligase C-terminal domain-containing protein [Marinobacter hydrocarbonoclasticus]|nr:O-antigen ligase C-terminal domain-containing protein [Marinobacter nauticus]
MSNATRDGQLNPLYLSSWGLLWLLAMHYFQPNGGGIALGLAFNSTSWMALSLILALGAWQIARKGASTLTPLQPASVLCLIALMLPLTWSPDPWVGQTYGRYLALMALMLLAFIHQQFQLTSAQKDNFWRLIIAAGLIQALFCVLLYLFPDWLPALLKGHRPLGIFQHTNPAATFIGCTMAIAFYRLQQHEAHSLWRNLSWLLIGAGTIVQVLILSRTGVVGTLLALGALTALTGWRRSKPLWATVLLATSLAILLQLSQGTTLRGHLDQAGYRSTLYGLSVELIQENPITGVGMGRFQSAYMEKQAQHYYEVNDYPYMMLASDHPHNELLYWGVEGGILPMLALFSFGLWISVRVWRQGNLHQKAMWLCLFPILLHTQTEFPLYQSVPHLTLFAILMAEMSPGKGKAYTIRGKGILRLSAPVMVLLLWSFMLSNLHSTYLLGQYFTTRDPSHLAGIVNPFGQVKSVNTLTGAALLNIGTPAALTQAEALAQTEVTLRPSIGSYALWLSTLLQQGKAQEAEQVRQKAHYLFVDAPQFQSPLSPAVSESTAHLPPASAARSTH